MQRKINKNEFTLTIVNERINLTKADNGSVEYLPGEVVKLTNLLTMVLGMEKYPVLPPHIDNSPWRVKFSEDNKLAITHKTKSKTLTIQWNDIINLIDILNEGSKLLFDTKLRPGKRGVDFVDIRQTGQITED